MAYPTLHVRYTCFHRNNDGERKTEFPDDKNGAVLRGLWEHGDDLTSPREFDFGVVFEQEEAASILL